MPEASMCEKREKAHRNEDDHIEMVDNAGEAVNTSSMTGGGDTTVPQGRLGKNLLEEKNKMEAIGDEREKASTHA